LKALTAESAGRLDGAGRDAVVGDLEQRGRERSTVGATKGARNGGGTAGLDEAADAGTGLVEVQQDQRVNIVDCGHASLLPCRIGLIPGWAGARG
jgi:hypothetical protein